MSTILFPNAKRGHVKFDWLESHHSFSFGSWYNPELISFGALRVINDDIIDAGSGFGTHPHNNMEIVTIPLSGSLAHADSTGTKEVIKTGEVQIMSAGTGIEHSEFNASKTEKVTLLQIWVLPKARNIKPRYDQSTFELKPNSWTTIVSPDQSENQILPLWINQDAYFNLARIEKDQTLEYSLNNQTSGMYLFLIEGSITTLSQKLGARDALGVVNQKEIAITAEQDSYVLLMEIPF